MSYSPDGIIARTGIAGEGRVVAQRNVRRRNETHFGPRGRLTILLVVIGVIAVVAVGVAPVQKTSATPMREGGNCGNCHPYRTTSFLTVTYSPTITGGLYVPGATYTVTITLADTNGATGVNSFDFIISAGGGTLTTTDPNAEINSATEASANDGVSPMSTSTWTIKWTAPSSGTVTVNTWSVMSGTATGNSAPYDRVTTTFGASSIPEFPIFLLPVIGIAGAVIVVSRMKKSAA